MIRIALGDLPVSPLAASALVLREHLAEIEAALARADVMIALPPADHTHREWRRALAAMLARAHTPRRSNVVAGEGAALDAVARYLAGAPGITGQYFETDGLGAG